jgi:small subunit ribosomal protein S13
MARLVGIDLPKEKRIEVGLTYIYGVGRSRAVEILSKANVPVERKVKELTEDEIVRLRNVLSEYPLEGDLRKEIGLNIKRLTEIGSYRGQRHRRNLPCRGQRTKTNARTRRGKRKTVAGKKKALEKT